MKSTAIFCPPHFGGLADGTKIHVHFAETAGDVLFRHASGGLLRSASEIGGHLQLTNHPPARQQRHPALAFTPTAVWTWYLVNANPTT